METRAEEEGECWVQYVAIRNDRVGGNSAGRAVAEAREDTSWMQFRGQCAPLKCLYNGNFASLALSLHRINRWHTIHSQSAEPRWQRASGAHEVTSPVSNEKKLFQGRATSSTLSWDIVVLTQDRTEDRWTDGYTLILERLIHTLFLGWLGTVNGTLGMGCLDRSHGSGNAMAQRRAECVESCDGPRIRKRVTGKDAELVVPMWKCASSVAEWFLRYSVCHEE